MNTTPQPKQDSTCTDFGYIFNESASLAEAFHFGDGNIGGHYTLDEYNKIMACLTSDEFTINSDIISEYHNIGTSYQGRPIYAIKLSDNPDDNEINEPKILFTGLHHAREPMSMQSLLYTQFHLIEQYGQDANVTALLNNRELWFISMVNPDGYEFNTNYFDNDSSYGLHRKNMNDTESCSNGNIGVDLNRNYGINFGDTSGASANPCSYTYHGLFAFSEPETQAVRDFVWLHEFDIALNYHSYGNLLIHQSNTITLDDDCATNANNCYTLSSSFWETYLTIGQEVLSDNGYILGTDIETVGYSVAGDSDAWMTLYGNSPNTIIEENHIYVFTPEVGNQIDGFWPSASRIEPLAQENLAMNIKAAWLAGTYYHAEQAANGGITITNIGASQIPNTRICGDSNDDITLNIFDIITSVNWITNQYQPSTATHCKAVQADLDHNGTLNLEDINLLVNNILYETTSTCPTAYITNQNDQLIETITLQIGDYTLQNTPNGNSVLIHDCLQNYTFDVSIEPITEIIFF